MKGVRLSIVILTVFAMFSGLAARGGLRPSRGALCVAFAQLPPQTNILRSEESEDKKYFIIRPAQGLHFDKFYVYDAKNQQVEKSPNLLGSFLRFADKGPLEDYLKTLGITFERDTGEKIVSIKIPKLDGLNALLDARSRRASGRDSPIRFGIRKEFPGIIPHVDLARAWAKGELIVASEGGEFFHDVLLHGPAYLLLSEHPALVGLHQTRVARLLERYDAASGPEKENIKLKIEDAMSRLDTDSYDAVFKLTQEGLSRQDRMAWIRDKFFRVVNEEGLPEQESARRKELCEKAANQILDRLIPR